MDPTECLKKLKDFFCPSGVSTSNYGLVVRYLLSDSESRDLYLVGQARESSFEELKRELLNTYGSKKSSVELIECIHALPVRGRGGEQGGEALSGATTTAQWRYETREGRCHAAFGGSVALRDEEPSERLYEPLGELDASAAAARTITDVTALSYASENERRREERWRPSTR
ncbi:hypothetical protein Tsp_09854 [Trichinella spiralis]|uniref:hypothetical protein n=1 Tax=Trichinella spiralis TaxID=6334 RepID=UPI0001EFDC01|nr:hypothetical protein Tsp_09854 [Trichinella spiralis]